MRYVGLRRSVSDENSLDSAKKWTSVSPSAEDDTNANAALMRFEFMEVIVRLAHAKFGGGETQAGPRV